MIYVIDTSSFIVLGHYFPERFPSFWERFDWLVYQGRIISTREVFNELDNEVNREHLRNWIKINQDIFTIPDSEETNFVSEIFKVPHFLNLLKQKQLLTSGPAADPFVISLAKVRNACVVTEESNKINSAKIPVVCAHFGVQCINIEEFMKCEGWEF